MKASLFSDLASGRRSARIGFFSLIGVMTALLALGAQAEGLYVSKGELIHVEMQSCQLQCGKVLSECEHSSAKNRHCPRDFQQCKDGCLSAEHQSLASRPRNHLCTQRCENSASLCVQDDGKNAESCDAGRMQCIRRCG